jgi:hypothetical protein
MRNRDSRVCGVSHGDLWVSRLFPRSYQPSGHLNISRARETYVQWTTSYVSAATPADMLAVAIAINFLLMSTNLRRCSARSVSTQNRRQVGAPRPLARGAPATQSNCGNTLKLSVPPCGSNARSGTRGKLRKSGWPLAGRGHGKNLKRCANATAIANGQSAAKEQMQTVASAPQFNDFTIVQCGLQHIVRYSLVPPERVSQKEDRESRICDEKFYQNLSDSTHRWFNQKRVHPTRSDQVCTKMQASKPPPQNTRTADVCNTIKLREHPKVFSTTLRQQCTQRNPWETTSKRLRSWAR